VDHRVTGPDVNVQTARLFGEDPPEPNVFGVLGVRDDRAVSGGGKSVCQIDHLDVMNYLRRRRAPRKTATLLMEFAAR
jgi:hypothetical protein